MIKFAVCMHVTTSAMPFFAMWRQIPTNVLRVTAADTQFHNGFIEDNADRMRENCQIRHRDTTCFKTVMNNKQRRVTHE